MGIKLFGNSWKDDDYSRITQSSGNPDPYNFKLIDIEDVGRLCVAKVRYPDCRNYEGDKILVLSSTSESIRNLSKLDPHFSKRGISPIARFEPTDEGWKMAIMFARQWSRNTSIDSITSS